MVYVHACTGMASPDAIRDSPEAELEDCYSDVECSPPVALPKKSHLFSAEATRILEDLYTRGMTGWGRVHSVAVDDALSRTGLELSQIKVLYASSC